MLDKKNLLKDFSTNLGVGEILRRARIEKKYSIEDIETITRVSAQHLIAIEENRLEVLPGRIYALGFIRSYAECVGLDTDKILELLKRQSGKKLEPKEATTIAPDILEDFSLPSVNVFVIIIFLFLTMVGLKSFFIEPTYLLNEAIPNVPQDLKSQTTLLSKPEKKVEVLESSADGGGEIAQVSRPINQIVLKAVENVWLEIRDSNQKPIFSRVLAVNEEYWIPVESKGLVMTLGNAGGLQISIDGQSLPFLGKTGQVIRKLSLDAEKLKELLKNQPKKAM